MSDWSCIQSGILLCGTGEIIKDITGRTQVVWRGGTTLSVTTEQSTATNKLESFLPIQASSGGSGSEYSSNYSSKYRKPPLQNGDSKG